MKFLKLIVLFLLLSADGIAQNIDSLNRAVLLNDSLAAQFLGEVLVLDSKAFEERTQGAGALVPIDKVMTFTNGVSVIRRGNYAWEPTLEGLSGGQVNTTIDGMRIFGACTDKMDPATSYVATNNLEKLEVSYLPTYGSSLGGGLDLQTKSPIFNSQKSVTGMLATGYDAVSNGLTGLFSSNINQGKWAARVNGEVRKNENYRAGGGEEIEYTQYSKTNFSVNAAYQLSKKEQLQVFWLYDYAKDIGYPALPMDVGFAKAQIYSASYLKFFEGSKWKEIEIKIYGNNIHHQMDDSKRPDVPIRMDMPGWSNTYGAFAQSTLVVGKHQLALKLDGYQNTSRAEMTMFFPGEQDMFMLTWPDAQRRVIGLFVNDDWKMSEQFSLGLTARIDFSDTRLTSEMGRNQFEVFGYDTSQPYRELPKTFSAQLGWKPTTKIHSVFVASYGERLPTISEQFGFYLFNSLDGYDYVGTPDISLEKSLQARWEGSYQLDQLQLNTKVFFTQVKDYYIGVVDPELSAMTIGAKGVKVYETLPYANISGGSVTFQWQVLEKLNFSSSVNYTHGVDNGGEPLPMVSPLKNLSTLRFSLPTFSAQAESEIGAVQNHFRESFGEDATPRFALLHFRFQKSWKWGADSSFQFGGGVENVFDTNYWEHLDWGNIPRPGRNFYVNARWKF
ncbi:TonB-dependent receptor [Flammeovirgaceae bacterium SG7u.111]|nr:TonB-dependent receptor [Flammeovirgaceae bacterium SG7u.132]WPO35027.1 TonB-dependent receptor [Flammeovirgaceae bacterium SG7u.111]